MRLQIIVFSLFFFIFIYTQTIILELHRSVERPVKDQFTDSIFNLKHPQNPSERKSQKKTVEPSGLPPALRPSLQQHVEEQIMKRQQLKNVTQTPLNTGANHPLLTQIPLATTNANVPVSDGQKPIRNISNTIHQLSRYVHAFYYPWYAGPPFDREWMHWNHDQIPDWHNPTKFPPSSLISHKPPQSIAAAFYPSLGPYSSGDPAVIKDHMEQLQRAGVGVISVSYYPKSDNDGAIKTSTGYSHSLIPRIMDIAAEHGIMVCFHIEPYKDRSAITMRNEIRELYSLYGNHPALFRDSNNGNRMVLYVYDSYTEKLEEWQMLFAKNGKYTVRGTEDDVIALALYVKDDDLALVEHANFDGFYTYFAAVGFTPGSTLQNWNRLHQWAIQRNKMFVPSVGPGYDDLSVRPWNGENYRDREEGRYYRKMWEAALGIRKKEPNSEYNPLMDYISITSFNEWHEGTQIECSHSLSDTNEGIGGQYKKYENGKYMYIDITKEYVSKM